MKNPIDKLISGLGIISVALIIFIQILNHTNCQ
jgi:hypothetical protein